MLISKLKLLTLAILVIYVCGLSSQADVRLDNDLSLRKLTTDIQNSPSTQPQHAFIKSAIIPGWGEISSGSNAGYVFLGVELLLWGSRFYFGDQVDLHEKDAYMFALQNAGLKPGDYEAVFMQRISRYNSSGFDPGGYNEHILRRAQNLYPDDQVAQNQYILENAILDDDLAWNWGSRDQRRRYSIKLKNADHNRDYIKFVTGAIVANHIISAINSFRIANRIRSDLNLELGLDLSQPAMPKAKLTFSF